MTAGKEAVKGKGPEVERRKESWGNATDEKDQGLRKAGGPAKGRGALLGKAHLREGISAGGEGFGS